MLSVRQILLAVIVSATVLQARVAGADNKMVLVIAPRTSGVSPGDAKFLLSLLSGAISHRGRYDVVDAKKAADAVDIHADINPVCLKDPTCAAAIADELHADLFVQAALAKTGEKFLLQTWLYRADTSALVAKHAESMENIANLKMNSEVCVREIFHSFETGARPPKDDSVAPPPAPKPAPVVQEEQPEAPPSRPARKPLVAAANAPDTVEDEAAIVPIPPKRKPPPPPPKRRPADDEEEDEDVAPARPVRPAPRPPPAKPVAKPKPKVVQKTRILVLDVDAFKGAKKDAARLNDTVVDLIAVHPGYVVVDADEMHAAEKKRLKKDKKCLQKKDCQHALGKDVNAELMIITKLSKSRKGFALEMSLAIVGDTTSAIRHTETMHTLKSLKMNADLCVKALFK